MKKLMRYLLAILVIVAFAAGAVSAVTTKPAHAASSLVQITANFGANPTNLGFYIYVPINVAPHPAILVVLHYCHGDATGMFNGSQFDELSETYGYIAIYPSVTQASDSCWDVSTAPTLTHNGGSDSLGIMSMVSYTIANYNGDATRVYATGVSSGAMMTNVLLGAYPDVFKAGAAFAGVPFGCFAVNPDALHWSNDCATGVVTHTPQEWGDIVRAAYPGYTGPRPRIQLWHGTADGTLNYVNFGEEIKEWTNVLGVSQTPTLTDSPSSGDTRTQYANSSGVVQVEGHSLAGVGHGLPVDAAAAIHFLGLDAPATPTPTITPGGPTLTFTPTPSITPTPAPGLQLKIQGNGAETTSISSMNLQVLNTGAASLSNVSWRLYFTTENGNAASGYTLEKYYDQSGLAAISAPTLACGSVYYFTISYGATAVPAGTVWAFNTGLHLSSYATTYNGLNDWWHTGYAYSALPASPTIDYYLPGYVNGSLVWGAEPNCGNVTPTYTPTRTLTPVITLTGSPTRTSTPVITSTPTVTATRTLTPAISPTGTMTNTPTRTPTIGITLTPTRTSTVGITNTPTRTLTPPAITNTPTITLTVGTGTCSPVTSTITAPFTYDGAGTFCWQSSNLGTYINSWNVTSLKVNGVSFTNVYTAAGSLPAKINGYWYVSYNSTVSYGHFETK